MRRRRINVDIGFRICTSTVDEILQYEAEKRLICPLLLHTMGAAFHIEKKNYSPPLPVCLGHGPTVAGGQDFVYAEK